MLTLIYFTGVKSNPSKEQMVRHIVNISRCVESEDGRKLSGDKSELLVEVMTSLYQYLQLYAMEDEYTAEQLKYTSCVIIGRLNIGHQFTGSYQLTG